MARARTSRCWRRTVATRIPGVIVVGSAAKVAWGVTKFTAKHVVKPIAKTLFVRAAPTAGKFALKKSAKYLLPFVAKLSVL